MIRRLGPLVCACAAACVVGGVQLAAAQISADQVRQRYDRQTKGGSIDEFARQMNSDDASERLKGLRSLSESNDPKAVEYLVQALGDPDMRIKAKAIDSCGSLRATDANGTVFVVPLMNPFVLRCLNDVAACDGVCGACPGPTFAACVTVVSSDSCDTLCAKVGRACSTSCAPRVLRYNTGQCNSADWEGRLIETMDTTCSTKFGTLGFDGGSGEAGISCCCQ